MIIRWQRNICVCGGVLLPGTVTHGLLAFLSSNLENAAFQFPSFYFFFLWIPERQCTLFLTFCGFSFSDVLIQLYSSLLTSIFKEGGFLDTNSNFSLLFPLHPPAEAQICSFPGLWFLSTSNATVTKRKKGREKESKKERKKERNEGRNEGRERVKER